MATHVTMRHVRQAKMCSRGARDFCRRHHLDYTRFLREGLPVSELIAIDDAMLARVIAIAVEEAD